MGDVGAYLDGINWPLAFAVAIVAVLAFAVVLRFLLVTAEQLLADLPWLRGRLGLTVLAARRDVPTEPWLCGACRSMNDATAERCYRGCGPREEHLLVVTAEEPIGPRAARPRRRG